MSSSKREHPLLEKTIIAIEKVKLTYNNTVAKSRIPKKFLKIIQRYFDVDTFNTHLVFENGVPHLEIHWSKERQ